VFLGSAQFLDSCLASGKLIENYCDASGTHTQSEIDCAASGLTCRLAGSGLAYCG
jgi:hypothetical protein